MDALIEKIVSIISSTLRPSKVILFGSHALGAAGPDSDIDLLIIYDGVLTKREVKLFVHRLFAERDFALDVFVLNSDEFERQKKIVSTVGRVAHQQGVVCYG